MASVFTRIIAGELPARFVWQGEHSVAFLSINPLAPGHALVVPRQEVDHWIDLDDDTVAHLMRVARAIGRAQMRAFGCRRIGLLIAGYEVPHTHVHVVPTNSMAELSFANAERDPDPEQMDRAAEAIRRALAEA